MRGTFSTSFTKLLVDALGEIQSWANTISQQLGNLSQLVESVTTTGKVSFVVTNLVVSVDQPTNKLLFKVQYADGTIKTGVVALT